MIDWIKYRTTTIYIVFCWLWLCFLNIYHVMKTNTVKKSMFIPFLKCMKTWIIKTEENIEVKTFSFAKSGFPYVMSDQTQGWQHCRMNKYGPYGSTHPHPSEQARAQTFWGAGAQTKKKRAPNATKIIRISSNTLMMQYILDLRFLWQHQTACLHFLYE